MNKQHLIYLLALCLAVPFGVNGRDFVGAKQQTVQQGNFRTACTASRSQTDMDINNVRARLMAGGDMWWDGVGEARYVIPKVDPASGEPEVSSLYAGGIWLGAYDGGGNLIVAAQTYRSSGNDYWTGPLEPSSGEITATECANWDKHFTVYGADIDLLRSDFLDPINPGIQNTPSVGLLGWPARGNPHFLAIHGFDIRDYNQDLAPFIDANGDGNYDPYDGDHPIVEVTGCEKDNYNNPVYADQMTWWVYNDKGNLHSQTLGNPMKMEIQALSFAYTTTDAINNMTFYRYKLLNRNALQLNDTYFSLWTDPDLGCAVDDYIGCDTATGMGYVYNSDLDDDAVCPGGGAGYGTNIPALGVDYFKGPLDSSGQEIGLSSFQYYVNDASPIGNPEGAIQHYRYMSGFWRDGTPVTHGGNGYDANNANAIPTNYVFPDFPTDGGWSMCEENLSGMDRRFLHTSGPFVLMPGATNELISGVVWVPDVPDYPCPSLRGLVAADELAQNLFDGCFRITNGPDAPFIDVVEMDKEVVLNLGYVIGQNNYQLNYEETPAELKPFGPLDTTFNFQGYKIYQVAGPNVSVTELEDETKARMIYQCDVEDDIAAIANWEKFTHAGAQIDVPVPTIKVEGNNEGLKHTFQVLEDQFAKGNKALINHKPYYFCVIAYGHNEYEKYDPISNTGQANPYLQGRRNFRIYTAVPRINAPEYSGIALSSKYGDQPQITRLDGCGAGGDEFLEIHNVDAVEKALLEGDEIAQITYAAGKAPVSIKVVDPLRVTAGTYKLHIGDHKYKWIYDTNTDAHIPQPVVTTAVQDSVHWVLSDVNDPTKIWSSFQTLDWSTEQFIPDLGISLTLQQKDKPSKNEQVGFVGAQIVYDDSITYGKWYEGIEDGEGIFNMIKTKANEDDHQFDPEEVYSKAIGGWYPFMLCDAERRYDSYYLSLGNINSHGARFRNDNTESFNNVAGKVRDTLLSSLNNVNIVMSPNPDDWSRCIVVETANMYHGSGFLGSGIPNWKIPSRRKQMAWRGSEAPVGLPALPEYPSRNKDMSIDNSSKGMSWFPGYAYNVETGERLNVFFGENSLYNGYILEESVNQGSSTGNDMIFNPTSTRSSGPFSTDEKVQFLQSVLGGQHIIYVTDLPYDSCQSVIDQFNLVPSNNFLISRDNFLYKNMHITWASMAVPTTMKGTYGEIPPTKATVKLRVDRPYDIDEGTNENLGYPLYEFSLDGLAPTKEEDSKAESALDLMRVVPNPYYAYSDYEITELDQIVKVTNIPAKCDIRIYSLDGRFVREYKVDQVYNSPARNGIARIGTNEEGAFADAQITTSVEWDLKNYASVPVASGVYLIHIKVDGVGTKVLKSFIINRAFDSQRL